MKRFKAEQELFELLNRVKFHDAVIEEIKSLVVKNGITKQFVKMFAKNIEMIETLGLDVVHTNNFEKLKDENGLYSMKFKGKNIIFIRYRYEYNYVALVL